MRGRHLTLLVTLTVSAQACYKASTNGSSSSSATSGSAGSSGSVSSSAGSTGSTATSSTGSSSAGTVGSTGTVGTTGSTTGSTGSTGSMCTVTNALTCACTLDADCPSPDYICSFQTSLCIFQCATDADCTGAEAPPSVAATCGAAASGCSCVIDPATQLTECVARPCATDADCSNSQQCVNGTCVNPPPANTVTRCIIAPAFVSMEVGQTVGFSAQAYAMTTPVRVAPASWTWSASNPAVSVAGTGAQALATGLAASGGLVTGVTAAVGSVTCTAQVDVFSADAGFAMRVVTFDALSGLPVTDALVKVEGAATTHVTANGEADFSAADLSGAASPYTVSVFEDQFSYVTVIGTHDTDLAIPLIRNPLDVQGGFTGTVADLFTGGTTDIEVALVGTSIPGILTDAPFDVISGPTVQVNATAFGMTLNFPAQGGELLGLGPQEFKSTFQVTGQPGTCPDAGEAAAGSCGTRSIWTFGGAVPFNDVPITGVTTNGLNLFDITILSQVQPAFDTFNSQLLRDEPFTLGPADDGGVVDASYLSTLTGLDLASPPAVGQSLQATVKIPAFPVVDGGAAGGAAIIAGVDVPGEGFVPLGFSAGVAQNGQVSDNNGVAGQLTLNMAPAHNGIESGTYRLNVLATESTTFTAGSSASGLVVRPAPCATGSTQGLCFGGVITPTSGFLPLPQSASFSTSTHAFSTPATAGADLLRVIWRDANGRQWRVYSSGSAAASYSLPALPSDPATGGTFEDRSLTPGGTDGGATSTFEVDALTTGVPLDQLAAFSSGSAGATNLGNLDQLVTAFATQQYP